MRPLDRDEQYGAALSNRLIGGAIFGVLVIVAVWSYLKNPAGRDGLIIATVFWFLVQAYFASFRIVLTPEALTYRQLYFQSRTLEWSEIECAEMCVRILEGSMNRPPIALILTPRPESGKEPIEINAKVFTRQAIKRVEDLVVHHGGVLR